MRSVVIVFLLIPILAMTIHACGGTVKEYQMTNIDIVSVNTVSGRTEIVYKPILDSMYYCPGATIRSEGGRQKVSFVRCRISSACSVDTAAQKMDRGQWKIVIPSVPNMIDLVFSDGEAKLSTKDK